MHRFATVRAVIALAGAAILFATAFAPASADAAAERRGLLKIQKVITLTFPSPGAYSGELSRGKRTLARNAKSRAGQTARGAAKRVAKRHAEGFCRSSMLKTPVQIVHLSKPPFPIGTSKPRKNFSYVVTGPEPPIGDPVQASQNATMQRFSARGFKWEVWCGRANAVEPYG